MAIDQQMLNHIIQNKDDISFAGSALVRTIVLTQPENALQLVPFLDEQDTIRSRNARRMLCRFDADAVPFIVQIMNDETSRRTAECLEIIWAILSSEPFNIVMEVMAASAPSFATTFENRTLIEEDFPEGTEVDLKERVCDLAYTVFNYLLDSEFDRSTFRSASNDARDVEIQRFKRMGYRQGLV